MSRPESAVSIIEDSSIVRRSNASWLAPLIIVLAVVGTYWSACGGDFTNWDDQMNVTENPNLNPPTGAGLINIWKRPYEHLYIPLTYTLWWLLAHVARLDAPDPNGIWLNPYLFHLANLSLHIGASLVAYGLLRRLTARPWAAMAGALLFALHPLQVEAVAWVTGLKDVAAGLLALAALLEYVQFAQPEPVNPVGSPADAPRHRWGHYVAATALLAGAVLCKPSAVAVPLVALCIDRILLRRSWREILLAIFPWCVICAGFILVGLASQPAGQTVHSPVAVRPLIAGDALAWYLWKLVFPVRLAALYPLSIMRVLASRQLWWAWLTPAALGAVAWALRRRAAWLLAGFCLFVAALLPVLGLVPLLYQRLSIVADRYVYLAMLGPSVVLAFALARVQSSRSRPLAVTAWAACVIALGLLAAMGARQAAYWQNTRTLFMRVLEIDPNNDVAYCDLATDALASGQPAEAQTLARRAFDLRPDVPSNGITLATALERQGKEAEAGPVFLRVTQEDPTNVYALTGLAGSLAHAGRFGEAADLCTRALAINPGFAAAHRDMAMLLAQRRQFGQAVAEAAEAVRLEPSLAANHIVYGQTLGIVGRRAEAAEQFAAARALESRAAGGGPSNPVNK